MTFPNVGRTSLFSKFTLAMRKESFAESLIFIFIDAILIKDKGRNASENLFC